MKDDLIIAARDRIAYLKKWLSRIKKANENISDIKDILERSEWEEDMFANIPDGGEEFIPPGLISFYSKGNDYLKQNLPLPPDYDKYTVISTASITTSGSTGVYDSMLLGSEVDDPLINLWSQKYTDSYISLQEKQSRFEKIREYLLLLNPERVEEFDTSKKAYSSATVNIGERVDAGIAMRNLLEHYKGDLFEKAKKWPKENKPSWGLMVEKLAKNKVGSLEYDELIKQEKIWSSLHNQLTDIAKGKKQVLEIDLKDIWVKYIDHLFIVLGLIKLNN